MIPDELQRETIYGEVVAKANHYMSVPGRAGERRIIKDPVIRQYEGNFCRQVSIYRGRNINSRFILFVEVYYQNSQHDLDNSLKTILDCLQYSHVITDDRYCIEIHASKHRAGNNPRVIFAIKELEPKLL